ncbi:hypothetical protein QP731_19185 [Sphingomonas sp. UMB7805-LC452B]|uniref:hypothetical protein n=1 Tax=Sphingomonas zeae TaxID=1646122 RepID=UPI00254D5BA1|nr:hypothetical protein [Sphingomonas zeae]MDK8217846.1 hypothetical protein [Sphingomonas sp. UMB7805-LC452B]
MTYRDIFSFLSGAAACLALTIRLATAFDGLPLDFCASGKHGDFRHQIGRSASGNEAGDEVAHAATSAA